MALFGFVVYGRVFLISGGEKNRDSSRFSCFSAKISGPTKWRFVEAEKIEAFGGLFVFPRQNVVKKRNQTRPMYLCYPPVNSLALPFFLKKLY
jgi:hypothetical protein